MRPLIAFAMITLMLSVLVVSGLASDEPPPELRLHRSILDASAANLSVPRQALTAAASDSQAIIQFRGPITPT
ncbi:MAG TPA: hypothetical protein VIK33_07185, partial [Anaerolineae bacterium]